MWKLHFLRIRINVTVLKYFTNFDIGRQYAHEEYIFIDREGREEKNERIFSDRYLDVSTDL